MSRWFGNPFWRSLSAGVVLSLIAVPTLNLPALAAGAEPAPTGQLPSLATLQGKLITAGNEGLRLSTPSGDVAVTSDNPQLLHTLQDTRLAGRQVKLEGERTPDGAFSASHVFVVREGKLYRLRYYCHICNIPATEPGPCVCCQRPTELEEIPLDQVTEDMVLVP